MVFESFSRRATFLLKMFKDARKKVSTCAKFRSERQSLHKKGRFKRWREGERERERKKESAHASERERERNKERVRTRARKRAHAYEKECVYVCV